MPQERPRERVSARQSHTTPPDIEINCNAPYILHVTAGTYYYYALLPYFSNWIRSIPFAIRNNYFSFFCSSHFNRTSLFQSICARARVYGLLCFMHWAHIVFLSLIRTNCQPISSIRISSSPSFLFLFFFSSIRIRNQYDDPELESILFCDSFHFVLSYNDNWIIMEFRDLFVCIVSFVFPGCGQYEIYFIVKNFRVRYTHNVSSVCIFGPIKSVRFSVLIFIFHDLIWSITTCTRSANRILNIWQFTSKFLLLAKPIAHQRAPDDVTDILRKKKLGDKRDVSRDRSHFLSLGSTEHDYEQRTAVIM